jgi:hypothetical protein
MKVQFVSSHQDYRVRHAQSRQLLRRPRVALACIAVAIALGGCGDRCSGGPVRPTLAGPSAPYDAELEFTPAELLDASVALPVCVLVDELPGVTSAAIDAGTTAQTVIDQTAFAAQSRTAMAPQAVAWIDRAAPRLSLSEHGRELRVELRGQEQFDSLGVFAVDERSTSQGPAAARWLLHFQSATNGQRFRYLFEASADGLRRLWQAPVRTESDDNVTGVSVAGGVSFFWTMASGARLQVVSSRWSAATPSTLSEPVVVSDPQHNACEPTAIESAPMHPGDPPSVLLAYLNNHDDPQSNRSTADIVVRRVSVSGQPLGDAVVVTPVPRPRYSLALASYGASTWLAWRLGRDSESEGPVDGGVVAAVTLRADLRPVAEPAYISDPDAIPVGAMKIIPGETVADLFWIERRAEQSVTMHRSVSVLGQGVGQPTEEPIFDGQLPCGGSVSAPLWMQLEGSNVRLRRGACGLAHADLPAMRVE